jgi:integrase/recombinase XerC
MADKPDRTRPASYVGLNADAAEPDPFPQWFAAFLHDRQTRKPSAHTMKA